MHGNYYYYNADAAVLVASPVQAETATTEIKPEPEVKPDPQTENQ
jgi:hypothetical protein